MQFNSVLIALYARLSQDDSGEGENVDIQLREGEEYVEDNDGTVALKFKDNDISASKFSKKPRPDYNRLVAAIERGEVEVIIVTEMTRLYRRLEELLDLIRMAERTRLRGIWTTDGVGYDLSTPEGIHAAIAAVNNAMLESAKMSKRIKRKKKARARAGNPMGGPRAYGYEGALFDDDGNLLNRRRVNVEIIKEEAAVIKRCVARVIAGEHINTIIRDLNTQKIPSARGKQWSNANFKKCVVKMRYVIFDDNDPEQRGTAVYEGQEFQAVWKGLITREQHTLMMARFAEFETVRRSTKRVSGRTALLSGIVYCGGCGRAMHGTSVSREKGHARIYRCPRFDEHRNIIGCGKVSRLSDPLEDLVVQAVLTRLDAPEVLQALTAQPEDDDVSALVDKLGGLRQHRADLVVEYGRGEHTKADYRIMLAAADEAIELAADEVNKHLDGQVAGQLPADRLLRDVWQEASNDWKVSVIKLLVDKIVILPGRPGAHHYKEWIFNPDHVRIEWKDVGQEALLSVAALVTTQRRTALARQRAVVMRKPVLPTHRALVGV
jgi:site-specific DNA recombinase